MAMCDKCRTFLMDHIPHIIEKEMDIYKDYNSKRLMLILPEMADWFLRISMVIPYKRFLLCNYQARHFARRTESEKLNQMFRNIATYHQLKKYVPALHNEIKYIHQLLIDAGVFKIKKNTAHDELPEKYMGIVLPNVYAYIHEIHESHTKGIKNPAIL